MTDKEKMNESAVKALFERAEIASLATVGEDGKPYIAPIHFVCIDGHIYFHSKKDGKKMGNIATNPSVCLNIYDMGGYLINPQAKTACNINTIYESITIDGTVVLLEDIAEKRRVFSAIIEKYEPKMAEYPLPDAAVEKTAIAEIVINEMSAKQFGRD